jgi:hypothetical protein
MDGWTDMSSMRRDGMRSVCPPMPLPPRLSLPLPLPPSHMQKASKTTLQRHATKHSEETFIGHGRYSGINPSCSSLPPVPDLLTGQSDPDRHHHHCRDPTGPTSPGVEGGGTRTRRRRETERFRRHSKSPSCPQLCPASTDTKTPSHSGADSGKSASDEVFGCESPS